jgi:hypothetical protein
MKSSLLFGAVAAVVCFAPIALVQPAVLAKSATEVNDIAQAIGDFAAETGRCLHAPYRSPCGQEWAG